MPVAILVQLLALHLLLTVPHELGHFIAARLVGVSVPEFGIGLPPKVVDVRWRGTRWSFNLLPLGAFVGYNAEQARPLARRSAIVIAGPVANFLVAIVCLVAIVAMRSSTPLDVGDQVVRHLLAGVAHPWGGDDVVSLVAVTWPELVKHLSNWSGIDQFLRLVLSASVVVGLLNFLPLPSLDGGKLLDVVLRLFGCHAIIEHRVARYALAGFSVLAVAAIFSSRGVPS